MSVCRVLHYNVVRNALSHSIVFSGALPPTHPHNCRRTESLRSPKTMNSIEPQQLRPVHRWPPIICHRRHHHQHAHDNRRPLFGLQFLAFRKRRPLPFCHIFRSAARLWTKYLRRRMAIGFTWNLRRVLSAIVRLTITNGSLATVWWLAWHTARIRWWSTKRIRNEITGKHTAAHTQDYSFQGSLYSLIYLAFRWIVCAH